MYLLKMHFVKVATLSFLVFVASLQAELPTLTLTPTGCEEKKAPAMSRSMVIASKQPLRSSCLLLVLVLSKLGQVKNAVK